jgi:glycosyltransferase A (GT-A) superfamily protein (DUF2064 family)
VTRTLVLFAKEPGREARAKGFASPAAAGVFAGFASGWVAAAERLGARVVVATPAEDLAAWRSRAPSSRIVWLAQRGATFGQRLENAVRRVSRSGGNVVVVGGDVAPDLDAARKAFEAVESGVSAALAPSRDGGVSILCLSVEDHDLLGGVAVRRRDVFAALTRKLALRNRRVAVIEAGDEVDRPADLRRLLRSGAASVPRSLARLALRAPCKAAIAPPAVLRLLAQGPPSGLRAPPRAA